MEPFVFTALLLALLGLHVVLSLLGFALDLVHDVLHSLFGQARKRTFRTSSFGSHDKDKEQDLWISSMGRLHGLDMFELNRLKFEQSLEHRLPEFHTAELACTSVHDHPVETYTISIFDQVFTLTCKQMEGLQVIQELLSEISSAAPNVNIRMCSSGLMPNPQTGVLGTIANIRNQLRLVANKGTAQSNYLSL